MAKINRDNWSELFTIIKPENLDVKWILPTEVVNKCNDMEIHSFKTLNYTGLILQYIKKNNNFSERQKQLYKIFSSSFYHKFHCCHHFSQLMGQLYENIELDKKEGFWYQIQHNKKIQLDLKQVRFYGTIYYESFIYHLLSSIDNLRILIHLIIPKYVSDLTRTYHKALKSLTQHHVSNEEISKYLFKEDELWINNMYNVRADIYHNYSEPLEPTNLTVFLAGDKKGFNYIDTSIDLRVYNASISKRPFVTLDELLGGIQLRLFLLFYNLTYLLYYYKKPENLIDIINTFRTYCEPEKT